ncbi:hypothetical protein HBI56_085090 [Parastagonospora nodorum]|uniref:Shikimate dehydrogenase substrate binding N-terminal domain-containing protein n=1 Tax=Phaeosphaeria nodorum (strain SN15 / ATCC MYA-4574 / FGSC 10173) TaxID=321614 RepID=A0A7U2I747_PHANO|nr:hypothetical protein HBH56_101480 [Parastagonospora nodorum]QRD04445.1 hypothetical protein JI435_104110 [Parastagonospora nodorum SN15]KAH3929332.1 hypothetical protein HBH54_128950 [Parastagonospora nodorum]KAH3951395.1 hypothetical protein HBH53_062950 [Parastagonospora nodorum]KAH3975350.1 hypothetical protein HBH52_123910 [Parastagonospora nodorum]
MAMVRQKMKQPKQKRTSTSSSSATTYRTLSPHMHNAAFAKLRYPRHYTIYETKAVDESVERLMRQSNLGGTSVTFPHKLQIGKFVDVITPRAASVGAVNTVVVKEGSIGGR